MVVMSSSMEPYIDTGGIVLMKRIEGAPQVGDVVTVRVPSEAMDDGYPEEVLHRVIEVTDDGLVRTQGDNLDKADPFAVPVSTVTERAVTVIPGAGDLIAFVFSPYGLLWLAAGVFLFVIMPFRDGQRELKLAIAEYGYHLRSHTEILKSMSLASQELAATTEQLRQSVVQGSNASSWATMQTRSSPNSGELTALPEPQSGPVSTGTTTTTGADETPQLPTAAKRRREKRRGVSRRRPSGRHRA
jgi:signal peptidase I